VRATVAYVRVSTDDQVQFSPDAQSKRCRQLAELSGIGAVEDIRDEGWSAGNLDRPGMRELMRRTEAGEIGHVVIWALDRLSRDQGDFSKLVRLFKAHGVQVHSVNEGNIDLSTASGVMNVGILGAVAQYQRDHLIENVNMGNRQAAEKGRWLNRAPTGYSMLNGELVPNEKAPLVQRIFELRASGASFPRISEDVGMTYSTVRHVCENRVYLGEVRLRDEWFEGLHPGLVTIEQFDAAQRAHTPGKRNARDVLSGHVRCGLCGRVASVRYNERGQALYYCRHRGQGCAQPGRSANGLQRALLVGLRELRSDESLQSAIRAHLEKDGGAAEKLVPRIEASLHSLRTRQRKLLDLHYAEQISAELFAEEDRRLSAQIAALRAEEASLAGESQRRTELAERFEKVAEVLRELNFEEIWGEANAKERRIIVQDLVESICLYPDMLTVQVAGAPPIVVTLDEVGLRAGIRSVVSEAGLEPARPRGHQPLKLARLPIPPLRPGRNPSAAPGPNCESTPAAVPEPGSPVPRSSCTAGLPQPRATTPRRSTASTAEG
jgi:site-specific DNA recombinase